MTEDDKANMKYKAEKCFKVLGFTKAENVSIMSALQLTLAISTSLISNNRLSRSENLVPA